MLMWLTKKQKQQLANLPMMEDTIRHQTARVDAFTEAVNKMIFEVTANSKLVEQNSAQVHSMTRELAKEVAELQGLKATIRGYENTKIQTEGTYNRLLEKTETSEKYIENMAKALEKVEDAITGIITGLKAKSARKTAKPLDKPKA